MGQSFWYMGLTWHKDCGFTMKSKFISARLGFPVVAWMLQRSYYFSFFFLFFFFFFDGLVWNMCNYLCCTPEARLDLNHLLYCICQTGVEKRWESHIWQIVYQNKLWLLFSINIINYSVSETFTRFGWRLCVGIYSFIYLFLTFFFFFMWNNYFAFQQILKLPVHVSCDEDRAQFHTAP